MNPEEQFKKEYYNHFASQFDDYNIKERDEHYFALASLEGILDYLGAESLLDVGSGTGRALVYFKNKKPSLKTHGIEPSDGMRSRCVEKGIALDQLTAGSGTSLPFADGSFDVVTSFGVIHHIRDSEKAISEMLRVARKAVFISDCNYMAQGSMPARWFKRLMTCLGLWKAVYWLRTGFKGYWTSPHDGLAYSFSVLNHAKQISAQCESVQYISTLSSGPNLVLEASHLAILGTKKK
jgi:ubiquinone/menaquinone biosynthesis C-methylase UbiE